MSTRGNIFFSILVMIQTYAIWNRYRNIFKRRQIIRTRKVMQILKNKHG